jgi:hypothetical protein
LIGHTVSQASAFRKDTEPMTKEQKVIRAKVRLLELARQLDTYALLASLGRAGTVARRASVRPLAKPPA